MTAKKFFHTTWVTGILSISTAVLHGAQGFGASESSNEALAEVDRSDASSGVEPGLLTISDEPSSDQRLDDARAAALQIDPGTGYPVGLDHEIAKAATKNLKSVLVHLDPQQDSSNRLLSPARQSLRNFVNQKGARIKYEYDHEVLPNVVNIRDLPAAAVEALRGLPGVEKVEEDTYDIRVSLHVSTPLVRGLQSQIVVDTRSPLALTVNSVCRPAESLIRESLPPA